MWRKLITMLTVIKGNGLCKEISLTTAREQIWVLLPYVLFSVLLLREDSCFSSNCELRSPTSFHPNTAVLPH